MKSELFYYRTNEDLEKFPRPNIMAEFAESHYSLSTLSDHMGHGWNYSDYNGDNSAVWDKLTGKRDLYPSELIGLMRLFHADADYLMSHNLELMDGKPLAYYRWYEANQRRKRESEEFHMRTEINRALEGKPYLLEFMKTAATWSKEEMERAVGLLSEMEKERSMAV